MGSAKLLHLLPGAGADFHDIGRVSADAFRRSGSPQASLRTSASADPLVAAPHEAHVLEAQRSLGLHKAPPRVQESQLVTSYSDFAHAMLLEYETTEKLKSLGKLDPQGRLEVWRAANHTETKVRSVRETIVMELIASLGHISTEPGLRLTSSELSKVFNEAETMQIESLRIIPKIKAHLAKLLTTEAQDEFHTNFVEKLPHANVYQRIYTMAILVETFSKFKRLSPPSGTSPTLLRMVDATANVLYESSQTALLEHQGKDLKQGLADPIPVRTAYSDRKPNPVCKRYVGFKTAAQ